MNKLFSFDSIPVYFSDELVAELNSFSPSPGKPVHVMKSWLRQFHGLEVFPAVPVSREHLALAHDRQFVDGVLDCVRSNGFGHRSPEIARSLPYTSGAMLSAARSALATGRVAVAPVSGFHHAGWDFSGGFCTFNGLMVTACALRAEGLVRHVGILDFDQHWGNGSHDIIQKLNAESWVTHYSPYGDFGTESSAVTFLHRIPELAEQFRNCDLILYQAGADPHVDDPLGGWLTTDQLYQRDWAVFDWCRKAGVPVAWNLAGGYQTPLRKVLDIHDNTMKACHAVFATGLNPITTEEN